MPLLLLTVLALIWGSSFILMKKGLAVFNPLQVGALRMTVAMFCLSPLLILKRRNLRQMPWGFLILSGLLGNGIPAYLFPLAQSPPDGLPSSTAGILNSLTPLFTLIAGVIFFGLSAGWVKVTGVLTGLAGALLLIVIRADGSLQFTFLHSGFIIAATICYAFSVNIIRTRLSGLSPVEIGAAGLLAAGVPSFVYLLFFSGFPEVFLTHNGALAALGYIALLAALGTALSVVLFTRLIKLSGAVVATSVTYLIPIVALLIGFFDGEELSWVHLAGMGLIMTGVYLVNKKPELQKVSASPDKVPPASPR